MPAPNPLLRPEPSTLLTATPAEGHALARSLATELAALATPPASTMAEMLQTPGETKPSPQLVTAIYFHAITLANAGWKRD